jgi:hypothetical protein
VDDFDERSRDVGECRACAYHSSRTRSSVALNPPSLIFLPQNYHHCLFFFTPVLPRHINNSNIDDLLLPCWAIALEVSSEVWSKSCGTFLKAASVLPPLLLHSDFPEPAGDSNKQEKCTTLPSVPRRPTICSRPPV